MAILSVALTRCLASFSLSILFFQHNPLFTAPFKLNSHTARSWIHRHTHCILINTCASTNRSCMLVNTFTQTHHRPQKPLRSWPAPRTHTAHLYGIQLWKKCLGFSHHHSVCLVWGSKGVKFFCVCVCSVIWIKTEGKHYLGSYLWSLTYSRDSRGAMGLEERLMYWYFRESFEKQIISTKILNGTIVFNTDNKKCSLSIRLAY